MTVKLSLQNSSRFQYYVYEAVHVAFQSREDDSNVQEFINYDVVVCITLYIYSRYVASVMCPSTSAELARVFVGHWVYDSTTTASYQLVQCRGRGPLPPGAPR